MSKTTAMIAIGASAVHAFYVPQPATPKLINQPSSNIANGKSGLPADVGFDPLGLANIDLLLDSAKDKERSKAYVLRDYRDAELKHGRLAMLAAVAWPLQEKFNPLLAAQWHLPNLLAETGGRSPSLLNGGLEQGIIPSAVVTFAVLVSLLEAQGLRIKEAQGDAFLPGDYGLPRVAERGSDRLFSLQEGEIWNGRIAMMVVLGYVLEEAITRVPTIATVPFFG